MRRLFYALGIALLAVAPAHAADDHIQLQLDGTGKRVDNWSFSRGSAIIYRQGVVISGQSDVDRVWPLNANPTGTEYAIPVRPIPGTAPFTVKGNGAVIAESIAVRCVNVDNDSFESCSSGLADTIGIEVLIDSANERAIVETAGQRGFVAKIKAGSFDGVYAPRGSTDGGVTYTVSGVFILDGQAVTSINEADPSDAYEVELRFPIPVTHAAVEATTWNSGGANVQLRATNHIGTGLYATDGTNVKELMVKTVAPGANDPGLLIRCISGCAGTGGTSAADNTAFTGGTTAINPNGFLYDTTPPAVTDGNIGAPRMNVNRDAHSFNVDGQGDSVADDANNAIRASLVTVPEIGGRSAAAGVTSYANCTLQNFLRMTTATTTEIIGLTASETPQVCHWWVLADGDTDITIVRGTGTNCGTGTATVFGPLDLTSTNGRGMIVPAGPSTAFSGASGEAVCVQSSAAVPVTIFVKYAKY